MAINSRKLLGHLSMVGANTMWGLMAPIAKVTMSAGIISSLLMTNFRIVGAALLLWCLSLFRPAEKVSGHDLLLLAGAGLLSIVANQGCFIFGVGFTSPAEASIITTTMPMWVMLLAALILREPITIKKAGGILLGATGAIILIANSSATGIPGNKPLLGDILVLTAQFSYALYLTLYKNFIRRYSIVTLMKWMFSFAALAVIGPSLPEWLHTRWYAMDATQIFGALYVVVGGTFIAYLLMMNGQKQLRPTVVGMYNYVQPIVATIVALTLGLDTFNLWKIVAVALIFTGVFLVIKSRARTP
ncbi:MAG: DMT family transporter [Muribaculaceae bacterium]|nr:DMT family transporter [Muribaculaceae bacterium]MDE5969016.1 DMT family transporter [Muribaculaceae bacterium]MDE7393202.1 DMT family transporter [Muribaculaceae bacterium]